MKRVSMWELGLAGCVIGLVAGCAPTKVTTVSEYGGPVPEGIMAVNRARWWLIVVMGVGLLGLSSLTFCLAQEEKEETELAKKTQNPVSDLISVPFQSNFNFGVGPDDDLQYIMNIQPVVPLSLTEEWNLITRTIIPLIDQPELAPGFGDEFGLGDIQTSLFLSPAKPGAFIWGLGPIFQFPSATDDSLGQEKWAAGPTAVALAIQGPWVVGALVNNLWSFAGDDDREDVNQMLLPILHQLQLPGGLVPDLVAHHHGQLGGGQRQHMDGADRRGCREDRPDRQAAAEPPTAGLLQRRDARRRPGVATALPVRVPVPKITGELAIEGEGGDDDNP